MLERNSTMDIVHLPVEIHDHICKFLTAHDFTRCVLVNSPFNEIFTPHLWRTMIISGYDQYIKIVSPDTEAGLAKHGHHVRNLYTHFYTALKLFVPQTQSKDLLPASFTSLSSSGSTAKSVMPCTKLTCLTLSESFLREEPNVGTGWGILQGSGVGAISGADGPSLAVATGAGTASLAGNELAEVGQGGVMGFGQVFGSGAQLGGEGFAGGAVAFGNGGGAPFGGGGAVPFGGPSRASAAAPAFNVDMLVTLLCSSPDLVTLKVPYLPAEEKRVMRAITAHLPKLRNLSLKLTLQKRRSRPVMCPKFFKDFLLACPETLENIDINVTIGSQLPDTEEYATMRNNAQEGAKEHPAMRSINIDGELNGHDVYILLPFLQSCTSLRSIFTPGYGCFVNGALSTVIKQLDIEAPEEVYLDCFDRGRGEIQEDNVIRMIHTVGPKLKVLKAGSIGNVYPGSPTGLAILANCQSLRVLDLTGCGGIPSSTMQAILCAATQLEEYITSTDGENPMPTDPHLLAMDAISSTWGCKKLRLFNAEIQAVPRPDVNVGVDGYPHQDGGGPLHQGTLEESCRIQRQIYQQIGALTELRTLGLGHDDVDWGNEGRFDEDARGQIRYIDPYFQLTCVSMSLESGLDLLGGLKELRTLDVRRMAHRIGVPELEWMKEHWPELRSIHGMYTDGYEGEPGVREWLESHEPVWAKWIDFTDFHY